MIDDIILVSNTLSLKLTNMQAHNFDHDRSQMLAFLYRHCNFLVRQMTAFFTFVPSYLSMTDDRLQLFSALPLVNKP